MSVIKLLFIRSSNPFFESSASANRFSSLLKHLAENGVDITVLITSEYQNFSEFRKNRNLKLKNIRFKYLAYSVKSNLWIRRINKYFLSRILSPINTILVKQHFRGKYDFIWLTFDYSILQAFNKTNKPLRARTIVELNEFNDLYLYDNSISALQKFTAEKESNALVQALKKIDIVLPMTQTLYEHYKKIAHPNAIFFHLPMTVDPCRFENVHQNTLNVKPPYIAYVGTFNNQKDGINLLIKSFAEISQKHAHFHLVLAGFHHYDVVEQKKLIDRLNLNDKITYLYDLPNDQVVSLIQNAKLLVLARPDSYQARGGFPTKLGEYLMTANPVCVTTVGEIPNYLVDNVSAFLAEPGNVSSFANAMDRALSNVALAKTVGLNGKKVALEHFNAQMQSERLYSFLSKTLLKSEKID